MEERKKYKEKNHDELRFFPKKRTDSFAFCKEDNKLVRKDSFSLCKTVFDD